MTAPAPAIPPIPNIAVVGCGHWGRNHARTFHDLGALTAVHDRNAATAAEFAQRHDVPARDFADIVNDEAVQGVVIAAPAEFHFSLAREVLLAGKHALVEKPLSLHCAEAEELCRLAERDGRVLMVGHILRYHPAYLKLRQMVADGELGRLQYLYSNRVNLGKIRREENILWSFAPHDISMILDLVGQEPEQVTATGANYLHKAIADVTVTNMAFPGGQNAHVFVSWLHPFKEQKLVVIGDRAMAVFDDLRPWSEKLMLYPHRINWRDGLPNPEKADGDPVPVAEDEPLRRECQHFLDCITSGGEPLTDGQEGLRVLRVLDQAEQDMAGKAGPAATSTQSADVMVHPSAFVDDDVEIGSGTRIWHFCHVLPRCQIGRNNSIGQNVMIGPDVTIGDDCKVQNNVSLYQGVTLEDAVFCGPSCVFTNVINPRADIERKDEFKPTLVRRGATIGANATIVCGNEIGAYAMIGAGAVVTRDVPAFALMAGVPARRIGWVSHAGERLGADLVCPQSGRQYRIAGTDQLKEVTDG